MKTILVVDDDDAIRLLIEMEFTEEGYRVLTASNAQDALKMVETEDLDLVILDIRMPGIPIWGSRSFSPPRIPSIRKVS